MDGARHWAMFDFPLHEAGDFDAVTSVWVHFVLSVTTSSMKTWDDGMPVDDGGCTAQKSCCFSPAVCPRADDDECRRGRGGCLPLASPCLGRLPPCAGRCWRRATTSLASAARASRSAWRRARPIFAMPSSPPARPAPTHPSSSIISVGMTLRFQSSMLLLVR